MIKYKDRVLEISDDHKQITLPDSRYYRRNGMYYPSVTYILSYYPKGKQFEEWLKKVGHNAEYYVRKAGDEGTMVHNMIEDYLNGKEQRFLNNDGSPRMDPEVWGMFLKFVEFWTTVKPELLHAEIFLFSDTHREAGTCDLVCMIDGEKWIIDFKTSNYLKPSFDLQIAKYAQMYEECFEDTIDRMGILWLKAKTRGPDRQGKKIQGKGWQVAEPKRSAIENLKIFSYVKEIFLLENPNQDPTLWTFPTVVTPE